MDPEDLFEDWKRERRQGKPPAGFPERVLASLHKEETGASRVGGRAPRQLLFASWPARAAVCTLAGLACLFRMGSIVALFIPG